MRWNVPPSGVGWLIWEHKWCPCSWAWPSGNSIDNVKIYHANALKLACTQLNIKLLHRPPRDPPAGGLIERFIQTLQTQLESEVRATKLLTLTELNQVLAAWLNTAYHTTTHSETNHTPRERYEADRSFHRHVDVTTVEAFFHRREPRTVDRTFVDVRIDGHYFKVELSLRGEKLIVKYDPFHSDPDTQEVELYRLDGGYLGVGKRYEREKGAHPEPSVPPTIRPIEPHYLNALRADQAAAHELRRSTGLDYHSAQQRNVWSLNQFANKLARLLGREGGLSSFSPDEMETLRAFHTRHDRINEPLLKQAFAAAEVCSIPHVLFQLQLLLHERNA